MHRQFLCYIFGVQLDLTLTWVSDEVTNGCPTLSYSGSTETKNNINEGNVDYYTVQYKG